MLVLHLWYYLTGYVRLRVTGLALEKFVNLCISRGIYLWGIHRDAQGIIISMGASNFRLLRPIARSTRCRVRILQKKGLPFYWLRLRGRQMLVLGLLLFFTALYGLGSFIWSIEVSGISEPIQTQKILTEVHNRGVKIGVLKRNVDLDELSRQIILNNSDLAWVNAELQGTLLMIYVVPKQNPPLVGRPCHMVARREGIVREIIVLVGEPQVSKGQAVTGGEILIRGILAGRPVAAQGIVRALVWPSAYGQCPRREIERRLTGNSYQVITLRMGEREIIIRGRDEVPFLHHEREEEIKRLVLWRNLAIPVEIIITSYREVDETVRQIPLPEMEKRARAAAVARIKSRLSPEAKVLGEEVKRMPQGRVDLVQVKVTLEVLENIAEPRGFEPEATDGEGGQGFEKEGGSQTNSTD